ncbi:MAG: glutamine-hydrolyzing carbamoyl-phosphate synthase small subunit [Sphingobacteriia bacterium]|nr:glutamine-hydrolyzing carbamoyl-phosphate synthase small subunit [Sphingobacteriia bacterium]
MSGNFSIPQFSNSALIFKSGDVFFGNGIGEKGTKIGEICFNTGLTGYQETLSDPSYSEQIITFTFPHIGNVGCNKFDNDGLKIVAKGLILRNKITDPSNFRSEEHFENWLKNNNITGIYGIDTRNLTKKIRKEGSQMVAIVYSDNLTQELLNTSLYELKATPEMDGKELAKPVSTKETFEWKDGLYEDEKINNVQFDYTIVVIDYGVKLNILRCLKSFGVKLIVVPADSTFEEIKKYNPDGILLSNGPGDPAETFKYTGDTIKALIENNLPIFGICLGHQLLGLALGSKTYHMKQGHRGANHPVLNLESGKVEISSQNHGFAIDEDTLSSDVLITHKSLFDGSIEGIKLKNKPIFSVQYHPEASPGPHDSYYLFTQFFEMISLNKKL